MEWWVEAAKQVPALTVLTGLVIYFLKNKSEDAQKSEERIKALVEDNAKDRKALVETLAANNQVLGSIQTLFVLVEKDLKDASRRKQ